MAEHQHQLHFDALADNIQVIHNNFQAIHHDFTKVISSCAENTLLLRKILDLLPASTHPNQPQDELQVFDDILQTTSDATCVFGIDENDGSELVDDVSDSHETMDQLPDRMETFTPANLDGVYGLVAAVEVFDEMPAQETAQAVEFEAVYEPHGVEDNQLRSHETASSEIPPACLMSMCMNNAIECILNEAEEDTILLLGTCLVDSTERCNGVRLPYDQLVLVNAYYGGPIGECFARVPFIYFDPGGRYVSYALLIGLESRLGHVRHVLHSVGTIFSIDSQDEVEVEVYELLLIQALVQSKFFDPGIFVVAAPLLIECQLQIFSDPSHVLLWSFALNLGKPMAAIFHDLNPTHSTRINSLEHLLVYSPSGLVVQYKLMSSLGVDSSEGASAIGPSSSIHRQDEELQVKVEYVQWWDVCRRKHWPERAECISGVTLGRQESFDAAMFTSNCEEVRMSSWRMPIWQKQKMNFYEMNPSGASNRTATEDLSGVEIEITKVHVQEIEIRRTDLLPIFDRSHRAPSNWTDRSIAGERNSRSSSGSLGVKKSESAAISYSKLISQRSLASTGLQLEFCPPFIQSSNHTFGEVMDLLDKGSTVTYQLELLDSTRIHWMFLLLLFTNCVEHVAHQVTPLILVDSEASYVLQPMSILVKLMLQHATFVMKQWLIPWDWCYSLAFNLEDKVVLKGGVML